MPAIRKKEEKELPAVSTASLPDIIFILLFFFMVTTVMRDTSVKVDIKPVKGTELQKLEKKSLVHYIYVGPPIPKYRAKYGTAPQIQLNDVFAHPSQIRNFISNERAKVPEKHIPALTTSLRVDKDVRMGTITDVKQELRKTNQLKISYSAVPRQEDL